MLIAAPIGPALPLGPVEFAQRLERLSAFESAPFIAVAVSGGPDSLALTILAENWARQRGGRICALSVDHQLRAESGAELGQLAQWLSARSIAHEILVWSGPKPTSRIQETARAARYRLLDEWCRCRGCLHLLMAHHRADQIETYLLRRARQSGPDGLAGMSAVRELESCRLLRPLLDVPKARLLATLAAEAQPFLTDPSNHNPAFARARLRACGEAADDDSVLGEIRKFGIERIAREAELAAFFARAVVLHPAGFAALDRDAVLSAPAEATEQLLAAVVLALGPSAYPPRHESVRRLRWMFTDALPGGYVLGGYRFVTWRDRILVLRELAAAARPAPIAPGEDVLWDGRFALSLSASGRPLTFGYLGRDGLAPLRRQLANSIASCLPALIHPVLMGFWDEHGLAAVPSLGYRRDGGVMVPQLLFRPVNSMSHASFVVV